MNEKTVLAGLFWVLSFKKLFGLFSGLHQGRDFQAELFLALLLFGCGFFAIFVDEISQWVRVKRENKGNLLAT